MPDTQISPAFLFALGLLFAIYGLNQLVQAYRLGPWQGFLRDSHTVACAQIFSFVHTWIADTNTLKRLVSKAPMSEGISAHHNLVGVGMASTRSVVKLVNPVLGGSRAAQTCP